MGSGLLDALYVRLRTRIFPVTSNFKHRNMHCDCRYCFSGFSRSVLSCNVALDSLLHAKNHTTLVPYAEMKSINQKNV